MLGKRRFGKIWVWDAFRMERIYCISTRASIQEESYGHGNPHYKPKTVWRPSQGYSGNPYMNKTFHLREQKTWFCRYRISHNICTRLSVALFCFCYVIVLSMWRFNPYSSGQFYLLCPMIWLMPPSRIKFKQTKLCTFWFSKLNLLSLLIYK